jgi:hypothetical protein
MNVAELKLEIIAKIIACDDIVLLDRIQEIITNFESNSLVNEPVVTYEKIRVFSEQEQRKINLALHQVQNGDYISDEEAQIEIEKWFEEQE